ncbi:ABC transporter ATP-binding protein [Frondihabitans sp. PAMC 28766]|uniref:ABC transporter ATP-binding protein n=1 Tax=Frondihabitans sp. PAMC 28766 TaxID=1795630 RepID=UPI0009E8F7F4|nr:ABC transporter ATP-binding protein [Frondihabitans sp. PAMC 28766]
MATVHRNAGTGRFTTARSAKANPARTTTEHVGRGTSNGTTVYRSAGTGKFVTKRAADGNPGGTIRQNV